MYKLITYDIELKTVYQFNNLLELNKSLWVEPFIVSYLIVNHKEFLRKNVHWALKLG